jgi:hypothetical protein
MKMLLNGRDRLHNNEGGTAPIPTRSHPFMLKPKSKVVGVLSGKAKNTIEVK